MEDETDLTPVEETRPATPPAGEHHATRRERRHRKKMIILIAGGAALLLLIAAGVYWFFLAGDKDKNPKTTTASGQQQTPQSPEPAPADSTPVTFKSTKLNVEFTHRKDWSMKESSDGQITLTSPGISYTKSDGQAATGVFTLKMRKSVTAAMKANIEKSTAPRKSEVIAYAEPTKEQRQYTNLSFAGPSKEAFGFFIITGNAEFKVGNTYAFTLPLDGEFYLIAGGYGSDSGDSLAFDSVPAEAIDSEAYSQALDIVKSLKIF